LTDALTAWTEEKQSDESIQHTAINRHEPTASKPIVEEGHGVLKPPISKVPQMIF